MAEFLNWHCIEQGHSHNLLVALNASWLAWSSERGLFRVAVQQSLSSETFETLSARRANCLLLAGETVAWAEADGGPLYFWQAGQGREVARDDRIWSLLNDGQSLIWSSVRLVGYNVLNRLGAIRRLKLPGGETETLADGLFIPDCLCQDRYGLLWFSAGQELIRLDPQTRSCQVLHTQTEHITGPLLTGETLIWSDAEMNETLWCTRVPAPGEALGEIRPFGKARDSVIELSPAPAGAVWIETPGYDEPYTLRAQGLSTPEPIDLPLPEGDEPASVACSGVWLACASRGGKVWLAALPAWLQS